MKYLRPHSIEQCLELLGSEKNSNPILLAGGTDLMPRYEQGEDLPDSLIDLKHLPELSGIEETDTSLRIGSLATIQEICDHPAIRESFTALHEASYDFAGVQIRHRGTIGGNIINASPAGDLLPPLYVFNAMLECLGPEGQRVIPIKDFILGPGKTQLMQNEILIAIHLERTENESRFIKIGLREAMAISVVNLAVLESNSYSDSDNLAIAAGAVAPTIVILDDFASAYAAGNRDWDELSDFIDQQIAPIDDIRATATYRRRVLKNLIRNTLS